MPPSPWSVVLTMSRLGSLSVLIQQLRLIASDAPRHYEVGLPPGRRSVRRSTLVCPAVSDLAVMGQRFGFGLLDHQLQIYGDMGEHLADLIADYVDDGDED